MPTRARSTAIFFLLCGMTLSACAQKPSRPPTAAPKTASDSQPAMPAAELRARMLALVDSLKTYDDTNAPHVEQVIGVKLTPNPKWDQQMRIFGDLKEGWSYTLEVDRYDKASDVGFYFFPEGGRDPGRYDTRVCSYDADEIAKDLVAMGYTRYQWPEIQGKEIWGFKKPDPTRAFGFAVDVSVYHVASETMKEGRPCIRALTIGHGELR